MGLEVIRLDVQERGSVEDEAVPRRLLYNPAMDVLYGPRRQDLKFSVAVG